MRISGLNTKAVHRFLSFSKGSNCMQAGILSITGIVTELSSLKGSSAELHAQVMLDHEDL